MSPKSRLAIFGVIALGLSLAGWRFLQIRSSKERLDSNNVSTETRVGAGQTTAQGAVGTRPPAAQAPLQTWARPADSIGESLSDVSSSGVQRRVGRTAELDPESLMALAAAGEGSDLLMPVLDGATLVGRVQRRHTEASGLTLVGGVLTGA